MIDMKNIRLKVNGMHCQSCEVFIRETLEDIEGVFNASANLKKKRVDVLFNDEKSFVVNTSLHECNKAENVSYD